MSEPAPYTVESLPPEPLYETMTPSPGDGWVWIDGYWHWDGYEWVWVGGRWEHQQGGYVYVQPNYEYSGDSYVYTPGYWSLPTHVPSGWTVVRDHRNGRPPRATPPVRQPGSSSGSGVVLPRPSGRSPTTGTRPPITHPGGFDSGRWRGPHRTTPMYNPPTGSGVPVHSGGTIGRMPSGPAPSSEPVYGPPTSAPANPPTSGGTTVIIVPANPSTSTPSPGRPGSPGRANATMRGPTSAPTSAPPSAPPPPPLVRGASPGATVQTPSPSPPPPPPVQAPAPQPPAANRSPGYRTAPSSDLPTRPAPTAPTQKHR